MKTYVSILNLRSAARRPIPAGVPFCEDAMVKSTLVSCLAEGSIVEYVPGVQVFAGQFGDDNKALSTGPASKIPKDVLNPPAKTTTRKPPESLTKEDEVEKLEIIAKLKELNVPANAKYRLDTLRGKLVEASLKTSGDLTSLGKGGGAKTQPDGVWVFDPEKIKDKPMSILLASYKERCTTFEEPIKTFDTREELLAYMSKEFVK